jgi:hypothetical protein
MTKNSAYPRSEASLPFLQAQLDILIGLPFIDCWRLHRKLTVQIFEFGRKMEFLNGSGAAASQGPYALHVSCNWRLISGASICVASGDDWHENDYIDEQKLPGKTQLDRSVESLCGDLKEKEPTVKAVTITALGDVAIAMTHGYTLELFPMSTEPGEYWRLMYMDGRNYSLICERDHIYTIEDELAPPS